MFAKIIMLEGPDGVGKTTQLRLTEQALAQQGKSVYVTRINGGSPFGEELRKTYLSHLERPVAADYYLGLAIHEAFIAEIDKVRASYDIILVDRSPISNVTYQSFGGGYPLEPALVGCDDIMQKLHPDQIICYLAPLATLRTRLAQAGGGKADYFESKSDEFFASVIKGYKFMADHYDAAVIDATTDPETVHRQTMAIIDLVVRS